MQNGISYNTIKNNKTLTEFFPLASEDKKDEKED